MVMPNSRGDSAIETVAAAVVEVGEGEATTAVGEDTPVRVATETIRRSSTRTVAVATTADMAGTVMDLHTAVDTAAMAALLAVDMVQPPRPPRTPAVEGEGTTPIQDMVAGMVGMAPPTPPPHRATIGTQPTPNPAPTLAPVAEEGVDDKLHLPTRPMLDCLA